jgi:hypothetical protein
MADAKRKYTRLSELSPEELERRRVEKIKRDNESSKLRGYPAQKRYREAHKGEVYEPTVRIPAANKPLLEALLKSTNMTITQLFVGAVADKYGVDLCKK